MKEEQRLNILKQIQENMKILKKKMERFKILSNMDVVKEYLQLEKDLFKKRILSDEEIKTEAFSNFPYNCCSHEIYFYIGGYMIEYDNGPESRHNYYREFDEDKIDSFHYCCLDCSDEVGIPKWEHKDFINGHKIIRLKDKYVDVEDFRMFRKKYFELLLENSTEEAVKKLVKE